MLEKIFEKMLEKMAEDLRENIIISTITDEGAKNFKKEKL